MLKFTLTLPIRTAVIQTASLQVTNEKTAYRQLEECAAAYRTQYGQISVGNVEGIKVGRRLFRALGIDPTKRRPSSEALLNRALKQKPLYSINSLVDVANWCALDFLLPNGAYDLKKIIGPVVLRKGLANESYTGLNNRDVNLFGRYCLVDDKGPFGSPITDSRRTSIDENTTQSLFIIFSPEDYDLNLLSKYADIMAERITNVCGGTTIKINIVDGKI